MQNMRAFFVNCFKTNNSFHFSQETYSCMLLHYTLVSDSEYENAF